MAGFQYSAEPGATNPPVTAPIYSNDYRAALPPFLFQLRTMKLTFAAFLLCFVFSAFSYAQESNGAGAESRLLKVTLAKEDAKGNIIEEPEEFTSKDVPIYCYVDLNDDLPAEFKVRYIAVKAKGLRPNTVIVTLQHKTKKGDTGASFHASPKGNWVDGDYAVEVFVDGKLVEKREFKISP